MTLSPKFVKYIPKQIEESVIYISKEYGTAIHKCACGCGNKVVTPLSATGWELKSNGETISLYPSIGNWNFECKSHYWIINNEIRWVSSLDKDKRKRKMTTIEGLLSSLIRFILGKRQND